MTAQRGYSPAATAPWRLERRRANVLRVRRAGYCLRRPSPQRIEMMTSQGTPHGRFQRAPQRRNVREAELAAREIGQLSLIDALALVACYARTGSPKFDQAAVRWLTRLSEERASSLRDVRIAAAALEALLTKQATSRRRCCCGSWGFRRQRWRPTFTGVKGQGGAPGAKRAARVS
jgi:hypothetical protein